MDDAPQLWLIKYQWLPGPRDSWRTVLVLCDSARRKLCESLTIMSGIQSQIKTEDRKEHGYAWVKQTQMPTRVPKKEFLGDCITRCSSAERMSLSCPLMGS